MRRPSRFRTPSRAIRARLTPRSPPPLAQPPSAPRCSSSRGRPVAPAADRHRGRAAPDGPPRGRRVEPDAAHDASPDSSSHGAPHGPRPSVSPGGARRWSFSPDGRACAGSGRRSPGGRSGRSGARSSSASHRRRREPRSGDRRRARHLRHLSSRDPGRGGLDEGDHERDLHPSDRARRRRAA